MRVVRYHILALIILISSCKTALSEKSMIYDENKSIQTFFDKRDNTTYRIVEIGQQIWFAENLKYHSPKSICYKKKEKNCHEHGRLYSYDELDIVCPLGWRVPNIKDWQVLKSNFEQESIYALLDTHNWEDKENHTNESKFSLQGAGYQFKRKLFLGEGRATTLWINQFNKFDEYYHVHIYGGKGTFFKKSNHYLNEVFHAHPIEDLANRRFSIRCVCDK